MTNVEDVTPKERALEAVLLFHDARPWDEHKRLRWHALTGHTEATTLVLCDLVRHVLATPGMRE